MKKTTLLIIGCILMSSMAFGMGRVGAEETPEPIVTATPVIALTEVGTPSATPVPESQERIEVVDMEKGSVVNFYDKEGNVIKKIEFKEKFESLLNIHSKRIYYLLNPKKFIIIVHVDFREHAPEEVCATGEFREWKVKIEYYDIKGNLVFRKEKVNYFPARCSGNGNAIFCLYEGTGGDYFKNYIAEMCPGKEVKPCPPRIVVLNRAGEIIYEKDEYTAFYSAQLSGNGKWLIHDVGYKGELVYRLINLESGKNDLLILPKKLGGKSIQRVNNDGTLFLTEDVASEGKKQMCKVYNYNPFTDTMTEIGVYTVEEMFKLLN